MQSELEAKFKINEKQKSEIISFLTKKATLQYKRLEINSFYDKNALHNSNHEVLRLREAIYDNKTEFIVTFKRKQKRVGDKLKHRNEVEFLVSDGVKFEKMISEMGYKKVFLFEKKRHSYLFNKCLVEIDEIPQLGFYCEIEGDSKEYIEEVLNAMNCTQVVLIDKGYGSIIRKHLNNQYELRF